MVIVSPGGPNWTDILTAIDTVGAVLVAVGIALWTERRSDRRIQEERRRSDRPITLDDGAPLKIAEQWWAAARSVIDASHHWLRQFPESSRPAED